MIRKKHWFDVNLELINQKINLQAFEPEQLNNKTIKYDLTKLLRGKACEATFLVKQKGNELQSFMCRFKFFQPYVKRLIGKGVSVVEDSFSAQAKDVKLRVKPLLITRKKVHRAVRKELRNKAREWLLKAIAEKTREKIFQQVLQGSLQKSLSKYLKKIYPLAVCELRILEVEKPQEQLKF